MPFDATAAPDADPDPNAKCPGTPLPWAHHQGHLAKEASRKNDPEEHSRPSFALPAADQGQAPGLTQPLLGGSRTACGEGLESSCVQGRPEGAAAALRLSRGPLLLAWAVAAGASVAFGGGQWGWAIDAAGGCAMAAVGCAWSVASMALMVLRSGGR